MEPVLSMKLDRMRPSRNGALDETGRHSNVGSPSSSSDTGSTGETNPLFRIFSAGRGATRTKSVASPPRFSYSQRNAGARRGCETPVQDPGATEKRAQQCGCNRARVLANESISPTRELISHKPRAKPEAQSKVQPQASPKHIHPQSKKGFHHVS